MTTEEKARVSINVLLVAAGWQVRNVSDANTHASVGIALSEVDSNLQLAPALQQAALMKSNRRNWLIRR